MIYISSTSIHISLIPAIFASKIGTSRGNEEEGRAK